MNREKYNKIVIGIDQSYKDTGISICADGVLKNASHFLFAYKQSKTDVRNEVRIRLNKLIKSLLLKTDNLIIIIERIRLRSSGFISIDYIKAISALDAVIVDTAMIYNIPVYSVDTRAWKAAIVGACKSESNALKIDPKKYPTIKYICSIGYEHYIKSIKPTKRKNKQPQSPCEPHTDVQYIYNDNIADSICIALFGFVGASDKLKLET